MAYGSGDDATAPPPPPQISSQIPQLVQKDKAFHPSLLVIPAGGKVEFPNRAILFFTTFSRCSTGSSFDLGLYESGSTQFVQFDKPGISYIFCNIHAQMSAVVIAVDTPYYARYRTGAARSAIGAWCRDGTKCTSSIRRYRPKCCKQWNGKSRLHLGIHFWAASAWRESNIDLAQQE